MGLFKLIGRAIGRGVENVGNFFGSERMSQAGRNIQNACAETSKKVSETNEYDKESAPIHQTIIMNEILSSFSIGLQAQADAVERDCVAASQKYFDDLIKGLDSKESGIKSNRLKLTLKRVKSSITGSLKNHLAKRVSLDDIECLQILQMSSGKEKERAMKAFGGKVIKEGLYALAKEIKSIVKEQNEEIQEFLEGVLETKEKELIAMETQFNSLALRIENDVIDKEKAKLEPLIIIGVADMILSKLTE
ncbi:hypothetical protein EDC18_1119 [Natranaerovirga pectinivora]|uniref:Uncharacterized protein n=1 Tax=Natranaerovirga pectinivora TaxID=682400 RepID=A0A4R3MG28_9FIRM|nr:hypothetical protein [Natranaerovirga pectinivora]TCT12838.1 hypothetical protein EDC18_1119 [Natranaerovirga pectinivora]